ncbi:hypothetical protein CspHIS471_0304880 [Cutaneotrichosporon sp. HIS471]|nr:hypothetical protein CspHIS471_0304880 [Cutaneotrichosporon sp. HIS471]
MVQPHREDPMKLPPDILVRVAQLLNARGARGTLASLSRASRAAYDAAAPSLYSEIKLGPHAVGLLGALGPDDVEGFTGFDEEGKTPGWTAPRATIRRLAAWSHVRRLKVPALPRDHQSQTLAKIATSLPPGVLMPRLQAVCFGPVATDQLRIWTPDYGIGPYVPPLIEALAAQRATHLCVAFRHVVADKWNVYREASTLGQYALARRLEALAAAWDLENVTFHDVVHQVLPSLPTTNIYEFAPHAIPNPIYRDDYLFPTGAAAVRLPGPDWNLRPWQMGTAIKNLFPSSLGVETHEATLARTRWRFCGVANHVLTKEVRGDDDSDGVWYGEVRDLVDESIKAGIARDLPARGLNGEFVKQVLERIEYGRAVECAACGREVDEDVVTSMDGLNLL